jgi:hypothetical protein
MYPDCKSELRRGRSLGEACPVRMTDACQSCVYHCGGVAHNTTKSCGYSIRHRCSQADRSPSPVESRSTRACLVGVRRTCSPSRNLRGYRRQHDHNSSAAATPWSASDFLHQPAPLGVALPSLAASPQHYDRSGTIETCRNVHRRLPMDQTPVRVSPAFAVKAKG